MWDHTPRILVVEDEPQLLKQICDVFRDNGWLTVGCPDIASAKLAIENARTEGWEFDAAVLDFYLPKHPEDREPKCDLSLCNLVRHCTLVWHISAHFGTDVEIDRHIRECHSTDQQWGQVVKGAGLLAELDRQVRQALATRRIKALLGALDPPTDVSGYSRRFRPDPALDSTTALLGQACADIKQYWLDLTPAFQNELRDTFDIELDQRGAALSVYVK